MPRSSYAVAGDISLYLSRNLSPDVGKNSHGQPGLHLQIPNQDNHVAPCQTTPYDILQYALVCLFVEYIRTVKYTVNKTLP